MIHRLQTALVTGLLVVITAGSSFAGVLKHEFWLGFGGAAASEKTVFNVDQDIESTPDLAISVGYLQNLDDHRALGVHIYGSAETTPTLALVDSTGTQLEAFDLSNTNMGARFRYTFARGAVAPHLFVGISWVRGSVQNDQLGRLTYSGISGCVGPGAMVRLGRHFMLSAEGFVSFGVARWENPPFLNSTGDEFDPTLIGATLNLGFARD